MNDFIQPIEILTPEELRIVNEHIDTLNFQPNKVFGKDGEERVSPLRSSLGTLLTDDHQATNILHNKFNDGLNRYKEIIIEKLGIALDSYPVPGAHMTTSHREGIQVLEYDKDQKYNWHFDAATDPKTQFYHRKISIVLYLSEGFSGGSTTFRTGKYKPRAGTALYFPSNWCFPHSSESIISGKKRVAVTWYYCTDLCV